MAFKSIRTAEERFWEKVEKTDGCWIWTGSKLPTGYGRFWNGERVINAHWFLLPEYPPKGKEACHDCDNPSCVRPDHIFVGTRGDNMLDSFKKGRLTPPSLKGSDNPYSKLTEEQAVLAKACPDLFGASTKMSELLGVNHSAVGKIQSGRAWAHLPPSTDEDKAAALEFLKGHSKHGRKGTVSSKLTEDQAKLAKACPKRYGALTKMAKAFDVHRTVLWNVRSGVSWNHLPETTPQDVANAEAFLASL